MPMERVVGTLGHRFSSLAGHILVAGERLRVRFPDGSEAEYDVLLYEGLREMLAQPHRYLEFASEAYVMRGQERVFLTLSDAVAERLGAPIGPAITDDGFPPADYANERAQLAWEASAANSLGTF